MPAQWQSSRVTSIAASATVASVDRVKQLRAAGEDIIGLATGTPDFDTPAHIKAAGKAAIDEDRTYIIYTQSAGLPELREAIAAKLLRENNVRATPDEILVTIGVKQGLFTAALACLDPGDEVLIPTPTWVTYEACFTLAGAVPVYVPCGKAQNFRPDPEQLAKHITPRTRMIMLNSPGNPAGGVVTPEALSGIAELAIKHDLLVLSDEIYEHMVFDGRRNISIASLPGMAERTLTFNGLSKAYAMTGWRVGYVAGPRHIVRNMQKIHTHSVTCAAAFAQKAAVAALSGPQDDLHSYIKTLTSRRTQLIDGLNSIPGIKCGAPDGGIFCFPDISGLGISDQECSSLFLEKAKVSSLAGSAFGPGGEGHLRMAFARRNPNDIDIAIERLAAVLKKI
ncbi:MAG: pyridoxal phosphate-dependent aminotransferase [Betaproteobacteria bacterium]|nr:pyridoxal phosphate-dependent aminotransferase [Betaproteobacteria bacterium]